jgi:SAM-dependent methyltransferase
MKDSRSGLSPFGEGVRLGVDQPWDDVDMASLYDAFPFTDDLALYGGLAIAQDGPVLELGCGSGRVLVALAQAGHDVVGVDTSSHMLALAAEKLAAAGPGVAARARLVQGDLRSFELSERFALAIIAVKTFAYLVTRREQQQALASAATHLRPGALLALDLLNPTPDWLSRPPGSVRQDVFGQLPSGATVARTETMVSTDLAAQVRVIRSAYEIVSNGAVTKRFVEWPFRFTYRFEAEHLLERAGFEVEAVHGGYHGEVFRSESPVLLLLGRRQG